MKSLACVLLLATTAVAQVNVEVKPCEPRSQVLADGTVQVTGCDGGVSRVPPANISITTNQASSSKSHDRYREAMDDYYIFQFSHAKRVYVWQYYSSIAIFFVVLILVFAGLVFAGLQFQHGLRAKREIANAQAAELSTIEASLQGIKVSSSTLGVLVLMISMCFFYLYLYFVYPINNLYQGGATSGQQAEQSKK